MKDIFKTFPSHFTKKFILETYPTNVSLSVGHDKFILHFIIHFFPARLYGCMVTEACGTFWWPQLTPEWEMLICLCKIRGRSGNPPLVWGYPPFLARRVVISSAIVRGKPVGTVLGGFRSPGGRIRRFPGGRGFLRGKSCQCGRTCWHGRTCRRGRYCRRCGNSFGGD